MMKFFLKTKKTSASWIFTCIYVIYFIVLLVKEIRQDNKIKLGIPQTADLYYPLSLQMSQ